MNGCQTSHVLFNERAALDSSVMVPLRLISTENEEVITSIIKATNRQTEVRAEQLLALSDFQKKLELFFLSYQGHKALFYERRSRQFNGTAGLEKTRIVTLPNMIRSFASIFLEEPHRTTRNYSALLDQVGKSIFAPAHRLEPYYLSALALYQLEYLFRNQLLDAKFKPARFQILMVARLITDHQNLPQMNSHEMLRFCESRLALWWDQPAAEELLRTSASIVDTVANGNLHRDHVRTQPFTEDLKGAAAAHPRLLLTRTG